MSEKIFNRLLVAVTILGCISVMLLVGYTWYLHSNCSIISYISNRG